MGLESQSTSPDSKNKNSHPLWRRHFPVDVDLEAKNSRRAFLGGVAVAGGTIACTQLVRNVKTTSDGSSRTSISVCRAFPPMQLEKKLNELSNGQVLQFHYPDERSPCLLIKHASSQVTAFSQKCTHLACPVVPDAKTEELHCPCHHGSFDMKSGQPLAGPPRTPLARVRLEIFDDGTMIATGIFD